MTTTRTRQLRGREHLLRRVVLIVLALVVIGILADRAITSFMPRSGSHGTLAGTLEVVGGPSGNGPRAIRGTIIGTAANHEVLTLSVGTSGRFTVHPVVGTYTFTATSSQCEGGKGTCRASGPVTVCEGVKTTFAVAGER